MSPWIRRPASHLPLSIALACAPTPASQPPDATPPTTLAPTEPQPAAAEPVEKPTVPVAVRDAATDAKLQSLVGLDKIERKVIVGKYGAVRLAAEGDVVLDGGGDIAFETLQVVDVQGERIQVVANARTSNTGLLLWIDAKDVAPQLVRPAVLHDRATRKLRHGDGTLELAPGELLDVLETQGDAVRVRTRDDGLTGWVDADALGPTWQRAPFEHPPFNSEIKPSTTVYVRPSGPALHKLSPLDAGTHDAHFIAKRPGWLEVEIVAPCQPTIRVRGFVRASTTEVLGVRDSGFGCGHTSGLIPGRWGELDSAPPVRLPADTELHAADGTLIGLMRTEGTLRRGGDGELRVMTGWGPLVVHTKP